MSINLENPETILGKVDAAANYVAQIRLAMMIGDRAHATVAVEHAERLLSSAQSQIEDEQEKISELPELYRKAMEHGCTCYSDPDGVCLHCSAWMSADAAAERAAGEVKSMGAALRKISYTAPTVESGETFREWAKGIAREALPMGGGGGVSNAATRSRSGCGEGQALREGEREARRNSVLNKGGSVNEG